MSAVLCLLSIAETIRSTSLTLSNEEATVKEQFRDAENRLADMRKLIDAESARAAQEEADTLALESRSTEVQSSVRIPRRRGVSTARRLRGQTALLFSRSDAARAIRTVMLRFHRQPYLVRP